MRALTEAPPIVVVDNGSSDGSADAVRRHHRDVTVIEAGANLGAAGRNLGVQAAATPYVAFSDDDSWWAPGSLAAAASAFERHDALGLLAATILVGSQEEVDPVCRSMAASPLAASLALPGPPVLGFVACGAVVRKEAFASAGGFHPRFGVGGEETLLALDLRRRGWQLAFVADVVAHHHPSPARDPLARRRREVRNALWTTWLRLPAPDVITATAAVGRRAFHDRSARHGLADALVGLPWVVRERRVVPPGLAHDWRLVSGPPVALRRATHPPTNPPTR